MSEQHPHMSMAPVDPKIKGPKRLWRCTDGACGISGLYDDVWAQGCLAPLPSPCKWCGQTPFCASDCEGILAIFNRSDVHVAGQKWMAEIGGDDE